MTENDDLQAIRAVVQASEDRQSDADGFAALLTDDVVLVNFGGRRVLGRAAVHEAMVQALATEFAQVLTHNEILDVRFPRPDVAVVSAVKHISDERGGGESVLAASGSLTLVLLERDGEWRIAVAQTTPIVI